MMKIKGIDLGIKWNVYGSDTLYLWNEGKSLLFVIAEGTGDNLLSGDKAEGYKDYWLTSWYARDISEGGQWMETELISDIDYTIQGVIDRMTECDLWEDNWKVIDDKLGEDLISAFEDYWSAQNLLTHLITDANK